MASSQKTKTIGFRGTEDYRWKLKGWANEKRISVQKYLEEAAGLYSDLPSPEVRTGNWRGPMRYPIKRLREALGYTLEQMAEAVGKSRGSIINYEAYEVPQEVIDRCLEISRNNGLSSLAREFSKPRPNLKLEAAKRNLADADQLIAGAIELYLSISPGHLGEVRRLIHGFQAKKTREEV